MALLDFDAEMARASDARPFANGFEGETWINIWCQDCKHLLDDCPLVLVSMFDKTPQAWQDVNPGALNRYHCVEYQAVDVAKL